MAGGDKLVWRTAEKELVGGSVVAVDSFDDFVDGRIAVKGKVMCMMVVVTNKI